MEDFKEIYDEFKNMVALCAYGKIEEKAFESWIYEKLTNAYRAGREQAYLTAVSAVGEEKKGGCAGKFYCDCDFDAHPKIDGSNDCRSQTLSNLKKAFKDTA